jgi:parallel beta-helix repeat protein
MKHRFVSLGFLVFLFVGLVVLFTGGLPAHAATFTVNLTTDAGDLIAGDGACDSSPTAGDQCTLRAAIQEANVLAGADVISVPVGTYILTATLGSLNVTSDVLINGVLSTTTIVDGSDNSPNGVFLVSVSGVTPTVTLSNLTIRNGSDAFDGGGVRNEGGNLALSDTRVITNSTFGNGGGIANTGTMTVTHSSILSNTATPGGDYGGGIYNTGRLTLINSEVSNNTEFDPAAGGGGIYNTASGALILTNTLIVSNTAAYNGGGIYNFGALTMTGSSVVSNTSSTYGGGLFTPGAATIASSTFRNNSALASGGIYAISSLVLTNTIVISNTAQDSAGGLSAVSVATITNSSILDNVAGISGTVKAGGGISFSGVLSLVGSVVKGNRTSNYGGGIYAASSGSLTISNTTVSNNSAINVITPSESLGGGMFVNSIPVTFTNSTLSGNTSSGEGGGIYHYNAALNLVNSTVSGNTANGSGGGINFFNPSPSNTPTASLNNVTITNNRADNDGDFSGDGGGFYSFGYGTVKAKNSILAGNLGPITSPDGYGSFEFTSLGYNLVGITGTTGFTATGDITNTAPLLGPLQNNGGSTLTHALLTGSPAIGGGNPAGCTDQNGNPLTTDQRGIARPSGARCDIGAVENVVYIFLAVVRR